MDSGLSIFPLSSTNINNDSGCQVIGLALWLLAVREGMCLGFNPTMVYTTLAMVYTVYHPCWHSLLHLKPLNSANNSQSMFSLARVMTLLLQE